MFSLVKTANAAVSTAAFGAVIDPIISNVVTPLIFLAMAVALVVFVYGIARMIISAGDEDARKKGKVSMVSGLIGLFIMLSAWGIIAVISNTIGQITSH